MTLAFHRVPRLFSRAMIARTNIEERHAVALLGILFCTLLLAAPASAATCGGDFNAFLSAMAREAAAAGISRSVVDSPFAGLTPDGAVLSFDRRQRGAFRKTFEEYVSTRVIPA